MDGAEEGEEEEDGAEDATGKEEATAEEGRVGEADVAGWGVATASLSGDEGERGRFLVRIMEVKCTSKKVQDYRRGNGMRINKR